MTFLYNTTPLTRIEGFYAPGSFIKPLSFPSHLETLEVRQVLSNTAANFISYLHFHTRTILVTNDRILDLVFLVADGDCSGAVDLGDREEEQLLFG